MKIVIQTIKHTDQDYKTVGNYGVDEDGTQWIKVSDMGNEDYNFLVALHELIEQKLAHKRGISGESITTFDTTFEEAREKYPNIFGDTEPGSHPKAPYHQEHEYAMRIEASMAQELGVDWQEYNKAVNDL